ncbi:TPR-like protein [Fomitopsis serialis]|uniref:TPR-like protein n=1 Tax=Fomitopsis serialis TaxID=139415 RepID=UPI002007F2BB|nr:TPR-like protein [Neoantrodia serialis]KAH9935486.1 TPR-like protein [Neoantrodia serialis]
MASAVIVDADMVAALRDAVRECGDRGLINAFKWASELLLGIPDQKRRAPPPPNEAVAAPITQPRHANAPRLQSLPENVRRQEKEWEEEDRDYITTARALFDGKDFVRAVHWLRTCKSAKAQFLSVYSQYMASEKQALRDWYKLDKTRHQPILPVNTSLIDLLEMVRNATDPFLLFLKALFLCRLNRREEAIESALLSIASYPWNWSTWMVLGECLGDSEELSSMLPLLPLPPTHPLVQMFQIKTLNTFHSPTDNELGLCDRLLGEELFPRSLWIMSLRAGVLYHMHDFNQAATQFQKIFAVDPYRIDDIDIYSNILYVTEDQSALSTVAHEFTIIDKDRPEICCLIGNYFSLRNDHEKAIKYFKRATQLDRTYLSAWTLMGHEYVETKNSHAAIEAYRKAVDVNRKDYRAWYGLGQAYELLSMHQYALHYYQRATALRPYDVRIWQAQGICYEEMGRPREAMECFKRALIGADPYETNIHLKLAKLHNDLDEFAEAASYHRRVMDVCQAARDLVLAKELLEPIASSNAEEVGQATELLKRARIALAKMQADAAQAQSQTQAPHGAGGTSQAGGV